ncbi:MAG: TIGR00730 family Rossman fold protein [Bacteroidales bacterium]
MKKICVFCGSSLGNKAIFSEKAVELAEAICQNKMELVYGGANVGIMKILADRVLLGGARAIGIMPQLLVEKEVAHTNLSEMHIVESMSERKQMMIDTSDAFIAFPGGLGTLDEIGDILTLNQLRISDKPLGFLNINSFFTPLLEFIDHCVEAGFVRPEHRKNLVVADNINDLIEGLINYKPLSTKKWIDDIKDQSQD